MTMITGSSSYARYLDVTRNMTNLQKDLNVMQKRLQTGKYEDGWIGVANDSFTLGNKKIGIDRALTYNRGIDVLAARTDQYRVGIQEVSEIASEAVVFFVQLNNDKNIANQSSVTTRVNAWIDRISAVLNGQKEGQRYLWSGRDYGNQPTTTPLSSSISVAAAPWTPPAVAGSGVTPPGNVTTAQGGITTSPTAPAWSNASSTAAAVWTADSIYIDDRQSVQYTQHAYNSAFQYLIMGLRYAKAMDADPSQQNFLTAGTTMPALATATNPTAPTTPTTAGWMDWANWCVKSAQNMLNTMAANNGYAHNLAVSVKESQTQLTERLKIEASGIEDVNITEVAGQIKGLQASLEASYTVTSQVLRLSLVQFLR